MLTSLTIQVHIQATSTVLFTALALGFQFCLHHLLYKYIYKPQVQYCLLLWPSAFNFAYITYYTSTYTSHKYSTVYCSGPRLSVLLTSLTIQVHIQATSTVLFTALALSFQFCLHHLLYKYIYKPQVQYCLLLWPSAFSFAYITYYTSTYTSHKYSTVYCSGPRLLILLTSLTIQVHIQATSTVLFTALALSFQFCLHHLLYKYIYKPQVQYCLLLWPSAFNFAYITYYTSTYTSHKYSTVYCSGPRLLILLTSLTIQVHIQATSTVLFTALALSFQFCLHHLLYKYIYKPQVQYCLLLWPSAFNFAYITYYTSTYTSHKLSKQSS